MLANKTQRIILKCSNFAKSNAATGKFAKTSRHLDEQHASVASLFQFTNLRFFATTPDKPKTTDARPDNKLDQQRMGRSILEEVLIKEEEQPKTTAQKVKKKAENTFFYAALVVSVTALGGICYLLFEYFFSNGSPQRVYSKALKMIRSDPECQHILGDEIAGFGEQSRRSRRHIVSRAYKVDDEERVRVTFHVKGSKNAGRVFAEVSRKPGESWEYRFLFIEMADRSATIVLINNR